MTLLPAILVSPFLRTKLISKIKIQMLSLHCVHYNELLPSSFLEQISNDILSKLVPVSLCLYSIRKNVMFRCDPSIRLSNFTVLLNSD